jgi:transposase-like protein
MRTLNEHNKEHARKKFNIEDGPNVLCDDCSEEMVYYNSGPILRTIPPIKRFKCPKCNKRGSMIVWN